MSESEKIPTSNQYGVISLPFKYSYNSIFVKIFKQLKTLTTGQSIIFDKTDILNKIKIYDADLIEKAYPFLMDDKKMDLLNDFIKFVTDEMEFDFQENTPEMKGLLFVKR